jgi:hypothetical protein
MIADDHFDSMSRQCQWPQSFVLVPLLFEHEILFLLDGPFKTALNLPLSRAEVTKIKVVSRLVTGHG